MPPARRWETDGEEEEATVMAPAGIVLVVEVEAEATDGAAQAIAAIVLRWIGEVTVGAAVAVAVYCFKRKNVIKTAFTSLILYLKVNFIPPAGSVCLKTNRCKGLMVVLLL